MSDLLRRAGPLPFSLLLAACTGFHPGAAGQPPLVIVHGNGDTAALWLITARRFESNGCDRNFGSGSFFMEQKMAAIEWQ